MVFSNYVFSSEILFWVLSIAVDLALGMSANATAVKVGTSLAAMGRVGNMGIAPQILTAYPLHQNSSYLSWSVISVASFGDEKEISKRKGQADQHGQRRHSNPGS